MSATEVGVDEALVAKAEAAWVRHHHLGTTAAARAVLAAVLPDLPAESQTLNAIAATLGKRAWRHVHLTAKYGGACASKGCDCTREDCHGVICGMGQAIDQHAAGVRAQVAEEIAVAIEGYPMSVTRRDCAAIARDAAHHRSP